MIFILLIILAGILVYLFKKAYKNTKDITLNRVKINSENHSGPRQKLNILHLSDLHLENISISPQELYERLKNEPIDVIALTGDFLDRKWTIPKLVPYLEALHKLNSKYGMYAVLGNHDYVLREKNLRKLEDILAKHHCRVMHNESVAIDVYGRRVNIVGIDDFSTGRSNLAASYLQVTSGATLVLTHDPNVVLHMKDYHFDYLLAGHFHGGQICYPKAYHLVKMGKMPRMNIIKGLHSYDNKPFYISEGLGQTGVNIRVGSRPEITLHEWTLAEANVQHIASAV